MRLICTLTDQNKAYTLSSYLMNKGIENKLEITTNSDWASQDYGIITCQIWSIDEDQMEEALKITSEFLENPDDPRYFAEPPQPAQDELGNPTTAPLKPTVVQRPREAIGTITLYILVTCTLLLFTGTLTSPIVKTIPKGVPYTPILSPPVNKTLEYDYPKAYEIIDTLVSSYGLQSLETPSTLPKAGQDLWNQFLHTPYWQGIYDKLVTKIKIPDAAWNFDAPLFEKERQGEIWRLFSPVLLHSDLFHLLFNMVWLVVLGRQIEQRLGKGRYLLFLLLAAFLTNTAQYIMSGSNFLGFSGILCAMLTFVWFRQKNAAWEGYLLERGTMAFVTFFILFLFSIQLISFGIEIFSDTSFSVGIGNAAHMSGALVGYIFSKMKLFAWR